MAINFGGDHEGVGGICLTLAVFQDDGFRKKFNIVSPVPCEQLPSELWRVWSGHGGSSQAVAELLGGASSLA